MKNDKICFSKTFVTLVLLIAVVVGGFLLMNKFNITKISSKPKADVRCTIPSGGVLNRTKFSCDIYGGSSSLFYFKNPENGRYYADDECKKWLVDGVKNFCQNLSTNSNRNCVWKVCESPIAGSKTVKSYYTDAINYYLNSSCQGKVGALYNGSNFAPSKSKNAIETSYCQKPYSDLIPLQFSCSTVPGQSTNNQVFYYQNGQYYKDANKSVNVTKWGVGNFCKLANGGTVAQKNSIVSTTCFDLKLKPSGSNSNINKGMFTKAQDLVNYQNSLDVPYYYDSALSAKIDNIKGYCTYPGSAAQYKASRIISYDCSKSVSKSIPGAYFYMKDNKLTDKDGHALSPRITTSNVCTGNLVQNVGCYDFWSTYPDKTIKNKFDCTNLTSASFDLGFDYASNKYYYKYRAGNKYKVSAEEIMKPWNSSGNLYCSCEANY